MCFACFAEDSLLCDGAVGAMLSVPRAEDLQLLALSPCPNPKILPKLQTPNPESSKVQFLTFYGFGDRAYVTCHNGTHELKQPCICIYIYIYIHACRHRYIDTYIDTYIHVCMHTYINLPRRQICRASHLQSIIHF